MTPRWPLTPLPLRSHVWLYPRIIVSKSNGITSMYVDTVINFTNLTTHTPLRVFTINVWLCSPENEDICVKTTQARTVLRNSPKFNSATRSWKLSQQTVNPNEDRPRFCVCPRFEGVFIKMSAVAGEHAHIHSCTYIHTHTYIQNEWSHSLFLN